MKNLTLTIIITLAAFAGIFGQNINNNEYSADKALKSNARVNPSSLAMELDLPLGGYRGRAGNGLPLSISYSSKVWGAHNHSTQWQTVLGFTVNDIRPEFAKRTAAGWTSTVGTPRIDYSWDTYEASYQGGPEYDGQIYQPATWENPPNNTLLYIKRLTVIMPDGSSHEFRASDTPIECGTISGGGCTSTDFTGTYLSVDGTRMRLEAGSSSSTLYMPDGSRYVFGAVATPNNATEFHDRHGNKMTYDVTNRRWTDTMGRVIQDPLPNNWSSQNQTVQEQTIEYPSIDTDTYDVAFKWEILGDVLLDTNDALRYTSSKQCSGSSHTSASPYLFNNTMSETRVCGGTSTFNPVVLSKVTLPNGQFYQFKYNVFGEIVKIIYPTGAYERFTYGEIAPLQVGSQAYDQLNRGVTQRWVSEKGDGSDEITWTYSAVRASGEYYVQITSPDSSYTRSYLSHEPDGPSSRPYGFGELDSGRPYDERAYDASSSHNLISRKLTAYDVTGALSGGHSDAKRDLRPTHSVSIIFEPGNSNALATMSATTYDTSGNSDAAYFSSLNPIQLSAYNYVSVSSSTASSAAFATALGWFNGQTAAVVSETEYLYDSNYKARNINGLVWKTRVEDGSNNEKAKSEIFYDTNGGQSLLDESESSRWADPNTTYRGLVTKTRSWYDISNNLYIDTQAQYDMMGNLRKSWDGRGNLSQIEYSSTYDYAYPTKTISPIPDTNGTYGLNDELESTTTYDFNTGLTLTATDPNGAVTAMEYYDPLLRPTKVTTGYGTALAAETITEYGAGTSASTRWVKVKSQIDATNWKEGLSWFDGLGRTIRSQSVDAENGDVFALTCYDEFGRPSKASNPFRGYNSSSHNCSTGNGSNDIHWTTNTYDNAGRPWKMTTPDGAEVETTYGLAATSSYLLGSVVTVEDQAGKLRRSVTNALGQLKRVDEPNSSNALGTLTAPNQDTTYAYDTLNNLTTVTQGAQTRTFTYDALARLKSAVNPESGTINYTYDANGNLVTKVDARSITTSYTYDRLNRVTERSYAMPSPTPSPSQYQNSPTVNYYYDNITNGKGKLRKVTSSVSTTEYTSFDILGRVTGHKQTTDGVDYTTGYTYKLSGALDEQSYPSGRVVKNELDVSGDLASVSSKENSSAIFKTYANDFTYNAAGAATSLRLGNGRFESTTFNSRLQPTQIALGHSETDTSLLKLVYGYGTTSNNGNVLTQDITIKRPGTADLVFNQTFTYDELNRLKLAEEKTGSTTNWKQMFTFDRYGNRRFDEGNTTMPSSFSNQALTNPTISTSNNRLASTGWTYDSAGNTTGDPDGRTFVYDAENKQVEVKNSSNVSIGTYFFDGDGKRVKKVVPSTGETTIFVYDAGGKLIGEYSTIVQNSSNARVQYLTQDNLGTPRINTDAIGSVTSRSDYLPYGEELTTQGGRSSTEKYQGDDVRQGFTGYENDAETDLDFAQARMYANRLGRFTGVDAGAFTPADPQNWNRFVYVQNNPIKFRDPTGNDLGLTGDGADDFLEFLKKKSGYELIRDTKTGKVTIAKGSTRNENGTSKSFAKLLKMVIDGSPKLSYETVKAEASGTTLFDNADKNVVDSKNKSLTGFVDFGDIKDADSQSPELATAVVSHFLFEGIRLAEGAPFVGDASKSFSSLEAGAHLNALVYEAKIMSEFTGKDEKLSERRDIDYSKNGTINFIYTTVQFDVTLKSTSGNAVAIDKITKTAPSRKPQYPPGK